MFVAGLDDVEDTVLFKRIVEVEVVEETPLLGLFLTPVEVPALERIVEPETPLLGLFLIPLEVAALEEDSVGGPPAPAWPVVTGIGTGLLSKCEHPEQCWNQHGARPGLTMSQAACTKYQKVAWSSAAQPE